MLSYEALREVPAEDIAAADYREENGAGCIYVEVGRDMVRKLMAALAVSGETETGCRRLF